MREIKPRWAGLAGIVVLAPIIASLAIAPASADGGPTAAPIHAEFHQEAYLTVYSVSLQNLPSGTTPEYHWSLQPPAADPGCASFGTTDLDPTKAIWRHGDDDGCNHNVVVAQGHPGTVSVEVRIGPFVCSGSIFGTDTMDSPTPVTCVDTRPSPTPSPSHTYQSPSADPSQKVIQQHLAVLQQQMADDVVKMKQLKEENRNYRDGFALAAAGLGFIAMFAGPFAIPLGAGAGACTVAAIKMGRMYEDPPAPDYAGPITPTKVTVPSVASTQGVSPSLAADFDSYLNSIETLSSDVDALTRAWEGAQGAYQAGDERWTRTHLDEAQRYAAAAAADIDAFNAATAKLVAELPAGGSWNLTDAQVAQARTQFPGGLPAGAAAALAQAAGMTAPDAAYAEIAPYQSQVAAGDVFSRPALVSTGNALAAGLRDFSAYNRTQLAARPASSRGSSPLPWILVALAVLAVAAVAAAFAYGRFRAAAISDRR